VLAGSKFGHGFAAAGISTFAKPGIRKTFGTSTKGPLARVTARTILGGTFSKLTGGKFGNETFTAAFSQLFDERAYLARQRGTRP